MAVPVRVDAEARRRHIVDAALRLIVRGGIAAATFRKVAAEAGLNVGSVRHYFTDHEALIVAVATEVGDRMGQRLVRHPAPGNGDGKAARRHLLTVLAELVPLDEERHREAVVLLEVFAAARLDSAFAPVVRRMAADLRLVLTEAVAATGTDAPAAAAAHLAALVSGLSLDAVTPHGSVDRATILTVLERHVATL